MNHSFIITQKMKCFDQVSNYKIAFLQKKIGVSKVDSSVYPYFRQNTSFLYEK